MNVGYSNLNNLKADSEVCPLCKSNIYINKYHTDYACVNVDCELYHGANALIFKVNHILLDIVKHK